ncbi:MAG: electron transfer flavoprotein subunit alpha/FixB family protein [Acidobacteriota bacterium]|nr:electron transfer flavoprotein subunit alpha/FixB family protein [Acidobacteriota bacterium]
MALNSVWVVVDRSGDKVASVAFELLTKAHQVAGSVEAITWGDASGIADQVGAHGASAIHTVGDLGGGLPGPAVAAAIAARIAAGSAPDAIFLAQSYNGRDIAGRLSARIDRPVLTNVVNLSDDGLATEHAIFGGTEILNARFTGSGPAIYVIRAKSFAPEESGGAAAAVDTWEVPDLGAAGAARVLSSHAEETEGPKLDEAAVVVSGGRGLGDADSYKLIVDLAKLLKGAPGASRAIVDAGWVPYSHQVGQTGKTVKPTVYIACGISGATQHMVGMKSAKNIIAVNKDQEAPIFAISDLGIVGDVKKVLPQLIEALQKRG